MHTDGTRTCCRWSFIRNAAFVAYRVDSDYCRTSVACLSFQKASIASPWEGRHPGGGHRGRDGGMGYVLHFTGVTSSGVPFLELIQPVAVRRHGHWSVYGAPRPSVTCNAMSSSSGALSIGFQPKSRDGRIARAPLDVAPLQDCGVLDPESAAQHTRPAARAQSRCRSRACRGGQRS
jgi:hypothetical protein